MSSDIRSFFGGKAGAAPAAKPKPNLEAVGTRKKRGRSSKVVSDDDEEDASILKSSTPRVKKELPKPVLEETTAESFFAGSDRPRRAEDFRPKSRGKPVAEETNSRKSTAEKVTPQKPKANGTASTRSSARKPKHAGCVEVGADDFPNDNMDDSDDGGDNFRNEVRVGRRMGDDYEEGTDEDDAGTGIPQKTKRGKQNKSVKTENDDSDEQLVPRRDNNASGANKRGKKRKSAARDELESDEDNESSSAKKRASPVKRRTPSKKGKEAPVETAGMKAIFDAIPTIKAPSPPPNAGGEGGKAKFQYGQHANSAVPAGAIDNNDIPSGEENCLAGLAFVFTGQLQRLGREQGQNLVKRYGGKVTSGPSSKTSYVVLGEDAGPKKLETIKKLSLKVINEDGLFELIKRLPANGGDSVAAEKQADKRAKEEEGIRKAAEEMDRQERASIAVSASKSTPQTSTSGNKAKLEAKKKEVSAGPDTRLWTVRYAPQQLDHICGNKGQVERLARWLRAFPKNQRTKFKMPGQDGSGVFRAVMIHGPPGIGKTTAAHLAAKIEGYDVVESNASDTRSKKLVESGLKGVLSTTSLMGYFGRPGSSEVEEGKKKLVLIMDEVDGMSAGDRGGVGALAAVCKKTHIPMILICNDRKLPKMKPFDFVTYDLPFRRPTTDQIRSRIMTIAYRENLKIPPNVINALIDGSGADIRQVVNMISTAKLDAKNLSYEEGKDMSKAWEKHIILKPWDMVSKILGGGLFNQASNSTLNDKQELYFNDHEFAPLMLQENYLGTNPQRTNKFNSNQKMKNLALLNLSSKAAEAISDGDLIDRMIHGSQQQWSLMPAHAMFSFVRPASFVWGSQAGHQTRFTSWLGKNSSQGKLMRVVKEIQGHMRLRISGDRHEVRQSYLPLLFDLVVRRLQTEGKDSVPEIIQLMDEYYLTKEDWDGILELGVGKNDMERIKIETQAKASFTRLYNQQSHPMPFIKASQIVAPKRGAVKDKPDLEEALDESDEEIAPAEDPDAEAKDEEDDMDLTKDKYVKQPKKKKAAAAQASKKRKKDEDDENESEEEKPKKSKGKGRSKR